MDLLRVENLTKTFPGCTEPTVKGVSFHVAAGEVLTLLGPSGCGKTTTLRSVMGFERAAGVVCREGVVLQDERTFLPPEKRGVGFVFQDYALFPHLSVIENVMFGIRGEHRRRRRQVAREAIWTVGLMGYEDRRPHDLSGGQQQRVALARALAPGNRVLLLDEPFSNLDPALRQSTRAEVRMLAEKGGVGLVLVTHDQEEALSTADRIAVMRDGVIIQEGSPQEVYDRPRTAFVAQFLGRTNLLLGSAGGDTAQTPLGILRLANPANGPVTLSVRPEHVEMTPPDGTCPQGSVVRREYKGHDVTYRVRIGLAEYLVQTPFDASVRVGDVVGLRARQPAAVVQPDAAAPTHQ